MDDYPSESSRKAAAWESPVQQGRVLCERRQESDKGRHRSPDKTHAEMTVNTYIGVHARPSLWKSALTTTSVWPRNRVRWKDSPENMDDPGYSSRRAGKGSIFKTCLAGT